MKAHARLSTDVQGLAQLIDSFRAAHFCKRNPPEEEQANLFKAPSPQTSDKLLRLPHLRPALIRLTH
jgi:hypothetical protein